MQFAFWGNNKIAIDFQKLDNKMHNKHQLK